MRSLNHIYRTIWSEALGAWIAVSEITRTKGKRTASSLIRALRIAAGISPEGDSAIKGRLKPIILALACCFALEAQANPTGGTVVSGSASINSSGNTVTVINTPGTIINWQDFSIDAGEVTHFAQQSASSTVLNRVVTNNPSVILGTLSSNGRVYLVNANGIMFGAGSTVDVAGLVATTLNLSDADFLAGRNKFTAVDGAKNISNKGNITAQQGGQIYLIAPNVANNGIITAPNGEILLAAGHSVELVNSNDPALRVKITSQPGVVTNLGQLIVESGSLGLFGAVVKNSGIISADSATMQGGKIMLKATKRVDAGGTISASGTGGGEINVLADMNTGTVNVTGNLEAKASGGGDGGFIETSAAHVHVADSARVSTLAANGNNGNWLIDPTDFTIAATGGDITGATLGTNLSTGSITITAPGTGTTGNGDIFVNDAVTWTCNTTGFCALTLNAWGNIYINQSITGNSLVGTAQLNLLYGQGAVALGNTSVYNLAPGAQVNLPAGFNFSTTLGSDGTPISYYVITALGLQGSTTGQDLQGMTLTGNYVLGGNIDASATGLGAWATAGGFAPIGTGFGTGYTGQFDGLGHTITGLYINRPATTYVGLFGFTNPGAWIRNVGLVNANITGLNSVGGLAGYLYYSDVSNSYVSGSTITGGASVGGLVGVNSFSDISGSYVTGGTVTGTGNVGGLVGSNFYGNISKSHVLTSVTGTSSNIGGLAGSSSGSATISDSYVSNGTTVDGSAGAFYVGGLVGANGSGAITNSHYNINGVLINGGNYVTRGGIYNSQYAAWVAGGYLGLNIANYASLISTGANSFSISTVQGMMDLLGFADNAAYTFTLAANINLSSVPDFYVPYLAADFNGANFTVSNLNITQPFANSELGLFGHVAAGSTVSNVALLNATVSGLDWVGALAGWNEGTIVNSHLTGASTIAGSGLVGGLVGENNGSISNSYVVGADVSGGSNVGGLVGYNNGSLSSVSNSYASSVTVTGTSRVGGLVGSNRFGTIDSSHVSAGNVDGGATGFSIGGLVGDDWDGAISNSYVDTGTVVSGGTHVGGLLGYDGGEGLGTLQSNTVTGVTVIGDINVGGLVGMFEKGSYFGGGLGYVDDNHVLNSSVAGTSNVGGLIGNNGTAISNSSVTGTTVIGAGSMVGGMVGLNASVSSFATSSGAFAGGIISNSYVSGGTVSGINSVGGLAGSSSGDISNSYVSGTNVSGAAGTNAFNVGGLAGENDGNIVNTYVDGGTVSGGNRVGGLVGYNNFSGTIAFSFVNVDSVTGSIDVGGVVGNNYTPGAITNTIWNTALAGGNLTSGIGYDFTAGGATNAGAVGRTSAQMMLMSTYAGWDISDTLGTGSVWYIAEGQMPILSIFYVPPVVPVDPPLITPPILSELVMLTAFPPGEGEDDKRRREMLLASAEDVGLSDAPTMVCK